MTGPGVADLLLRPTLVLLLAALIVLLLRRRSAAARHAVWTAALCGIVLIPLLGLVAPRVELPVSAGIARTLESFAGIPVLPLQRPVTPSGAAAAVSTSPATETSDATGATGGSGPAGNSMIPWRIVWLAGVGGSLLLLGLRFARLRAVEARAAIVDAPNLISVLEQAQRRLGVRREVRLLGGEPGAMPMAWGLRPAKILLPCEAVDWPDPQAVAVLLHELAHVMRRDVLLQRVAELSLAIFWFHPLAWLAYRRMLTEREHACDDAVLRSGVRGSEYAHLLLAMAHGLRTARGGTLALPMARPSQMTGRLLAVLDEGRARANGRGSSTAGVLALAVVAALVVTLVRPVALPGMGEEPAPLPVPTMEHAARGGCWHPIGPNSNHTKNEDLRIIVASWSTMRCIGNLRIIGRAVIEADSSGFVALDPGASISIGEREGETWRWIEIQGRYDGQPMFYGSRFAGELASFDEVDAWLRSNLRPMLRLTGVTLEVAGGP